jgi:hypothetical protein
MYTLTVVYMPVIVKYISEKIPWAQDRKSGECGGYGNRNKYTHSFRGRICAR